MMQLAARSAPGSQCRQSSSEIYDSTYHFACTASESVIVEGNEWAHPSREGFCF